MLRVVSPDELLKVYDTEVRGSFLERLPAGWSGEQDGPLIRCLTRRAGFAMLTAPADELTVAGLRELVDRTSEYYLRHDRWFEWKTFDHDPPALRPLLLERNARPQPPEALVLGEAAPVAVEPSLPEKLTLREAASRADLEQIAALQSEVWGEDWSWLADELELRLKTDPSTAVLLVEDSETVVSAAWLTPFSGTTVAGLWGGSTLPHHRRRGIYRALVNRRAQLAVELGFRFLQADASEASRPILEQLGLSVVGSTTPYVLGRDH